MALINTASAPSNGSFEPNSTNDGIFFKEKYPIVCIQGLGFVGTAMAIAVASARTSDELPQYNVVGVDLANELGLQRIEAINAGTMPFECSDEKLTIELKKALAKGNIAATSNPEIFCIADITIVDIGLDLQLIDSIPSVDFSNFRNAIRILGEKMKPGSLIIIETTVPPGTTEKIALPELNKALDKRGLPHNSIMLAHSYERVMPGNEYYNSIVNYWRAYAGHTKEASDACEKFFSKIINVSKFPLKKLNSPLESEIAKVLENSYRAVNIAFMEEWGRFAEAVNVDLFNIIDAIRFRPTHSNIRQPGFGVGGYCLTKDPLFVEVSANNLFALESLKFPFSSQAVTINKAMPLVTLNQIKLLLGKNLEDKTILLLGVSYRHDIGDTRFSPSETFVRSALNQKAIVLCHDPLVSFWNELDIKILDCLPLLDKVDVIVFAVAHEEYKNIDFTAWLNQLENLPIIFDANNVLSEDQRNVARKRGCLVAGIGRGVEQ